MKIKEISEAGFGAKALYALTGMGKAAATAATQKDMLARQRAAANENFIDSIRDQVKGLISSATQAGFSVDLNQYVNNYAKKNKFGPFTPQQNAALDQIVTNAEKQKYNDASIDKLAKFLQAVSLQQVSDPVYDQQKGQKGQKRIQQNINQPQAPQFSNSTNQIRSMLKTLNHDDNADDLRQIALDALKVLYKLDPAKYTALHKDIMTGKTPATIATTDNKLLAKQKAAQSKIDAQNNLNAALNARAGK